MKYYTYAHYRNDTNEIFYIGKGYGKRAFRTADRSVYWRNIWKKHGRTVQILAHWDTEQEAYDHEVFLIACMRDLIKQLTNLTDGGDAPPNWKGKKQSPSHIANRVAARKTANNYKHTEETKKNISEGIKKAGYVQTEEHKIKNSIAIKAWWDKRKGIVNA